MDFFATCVSGMESLLAQELEDLGAQNLEPLSQAVRFSGELRDAYRACLWSRLAEHINVVLTQGHIENDDGLFELARSVDWNAVIVPGSGLSVTLAGTPLQRSRQSFSSPTTLSHKLNSFISDQLLEHFGARPPANVSERLFVRVYFDHNAHEVDLDTSHQRVMALIGIQLNDEPLWQRPYILMEKRDLPRLRPDYAAAALISGGWIELLDRCTKTGRTPTLAIMFSGGATLVAEAAAMARGIAANLQRTHWSFGGWKGHRPSLWARVMRSAQREAQKNESAPLAVVAADPRPGSRAYPRSVLRSMGFDLSPQFIGARSLSKAGSYLHDPALVLADLSWIDSRDEAMGISAEAELATFCLGLPQDQSGVVISASKLPIPLFDTTIKPALEFQRRKMRTRVTTVDNLSLHGHKTQINGAWTLVLSDETKEFASTLTENATKRALQAAQDSVSCYRVYNRDLPDFPYTIDLYNGAEVTSGRWLVLSEFQTSNSASQSLEASNRLRLLDVVNVSSRILDVDARGIEIKERFRAKGGSQYATFRDGGSSSKRRKPRFILGAELPFGATLVEEGGLIFEVDFTHHLDTGLFLDTRDVRARIRELAKTSAGKKRFLNLFSYTGTATCYAIDGGCQESTTLDLSGTYLEIAERNLKRNGFLKPHASETQGNHTRENDSAQPRPAHEFIRADAMSWIAEKRRKHEHWDLIYCDPPTFSNSKTTRRSFDVQRDHLDLLIGISRLLSPDGLAIFCCNLSSFTPDLEHLTRAGVTLTDITDETIPFDFQNGPLPHHCYLLRRAKETR